MSTILKSSSFEFGDATEIKTALFSPAVRAIFAYGYNDASGLLNMSNLVTNTGYVAADTTGVGTAKYGGPGASYGGDRAAIAFGITTVDLNVVNFISNTGVVATDQTASNCTARWHLAAAGYGGDKAIFGFGYTTSGATARSITNLVSNTGTFAADQTALTGTPRFGLAAAGYGGDRAIFGFGTTGSATTSATNLVSNTGVVATDQSALTGTGRYFPAAAGYGGDKAIFGFGLTIHNDGNSLTNKTNLISNTGVVAADVTSAGTAKQFGAAASYGGDKAMLAYGYISSNLNSINRVSNLGVLIADVTGVGTARRALAGTSYGS